MTKQHYITEEVLAAIKAENPRTQEVMQSLVKHLHAFIAEIKPTDEEWMKGIEFLTQTGQMCDSVRQEFILFSDTIGVTALKDTLNNEKPAGATEATVLGPFYRDGADILPLGSSISRGQNDGESCYVFGRVTDAQGQPITGAILDVWQSSSQGLYEQQDENQPDMNLRGRFASNDAGEYYFKSVKPLYYGIPDDGPVGQLLGQTGRHPYRPAHIHFIVSAPGYDTVITQIFDRADPYINSDAVFGVKPSLLVDLAPGSEETDWKIEYNFGLTSADA